ncbi:hypothetical protein ACVJGD_001302 [Bradyrhizobium sp. USDA 10063]
MAPNPAVMVNFARRDGPDYASEPIARGAAIF